MAYPNRISRNSSHDDEHGSSFKRTVDGNMPPAKRRTVSLFIDHYAEASQASQGTKRSFSSSPYGSERDVVALNSAKTREFSLRATQGIGENGQLIQGVDDDKTADESSVGTFVPEDDWLYGGVPFIAEEDLDVLFGIERALTATAPNVSSSAGVLVDVHVPSNVVEPVEEENARAIELNHVVQPALNHVSELDSNELQEPNQFVTTELLQSLPHSLRTAVIDLPPQVTPATTPTEFARIVLQMHITNGRFPLPGFQADGVPANRFAQPGEEEVLVPKANIRPKDFLCGRMTVNTHDHDGNRYRKHLIDLFLVLYCVYDARHAMKSRLSRWIVTEATTGRFLEKVGEGMFRLMTFEQAWKTGVGQQFRDELRRRKKNEAGA